jgi:hypothetical protein
MKADDRRCDWRGKCKRKPYADVFPLKVKPLEERQLPCDVWIFGGWSYLCYWHLQYERIRFWIKKHIRRQKVGLGWGMAETTEEYLARCEEERIWEEEYHRTEMAKAQTDSELEALERELIETDAARAEECGYYEGETHE